MIYLRNHDVHDQIADLDPHTGSYSLGSAGNTSGEGEKTTTGYFSILSGSFIAFFVESGKLYCQVSGTLIELTDDTVATVSGPASDRHFLVKRNGLEIASMRYSLARQPHYEDDLTPFVGEEDFDFGILISNISADKRRKNVILGLE